MSGRWAVDAGLEEIPRPRIELRWRGPLSFVFKPRWELTASLKVVVDPHLDTASQRPPTGLDPGARRLIVSATEAAPASIVQLFFRDTYADFDDYLRAVSAVWGSEPGQELYAAVDYAEHGDPMLLGSTSRRPDEVAIALLQSMPEPDFRAAIAKAYSSFPARSYQQEDRITHICRSRGAPWAFTLEDGFVWTGDEEIHTHAMTPALAALADPRFAGGVNSEFESARQELALGTPTALSQSVQQAGRGRRKRYEGRSRRASRCLSA